MVSKRERAIEVMGNRMIVGVDRIEADDGSIAERWALLRSEVSHSVGEVAWGSMATIMPSEERTKKGVAEHLSKLAINDLEDILRGAARFAANNYLDGTGSIAEILHRSKRLLSVAALKDGDKKFLFDIIFNKQRTDGRLNSGSLNDLDAPFTWRESLEGTLSLDWAPPVKDWIAIRETPDSGCPAAGITYKDEGRTTTVLREFYTRSVDAIYGDYSPQLEYAQYEEMAIVKEFDKKELTHELHQFREFIRTYTALPIGEFGSKSYAVEASLFPGLPIDTVEFKVEDWRGIDETAYTVTLKIADNNILEYLVTDSDSGASISYGDGDQYIEYDDAQLVNALCQIREHIVPNIPLT
jgi:hypothetical protein